MIEPTSPEHTLAVWVDQARGESTRDLIGEVNGEATPELRKLVDTAAMLRSIPLEPEPELARVARLRFQEIAFARRASDQAAQARRRQRRRLGPAYSLLTTAPLWRTMSIVLAVIAVILSASFARDSSVALPGDATYGVKRAVETLGTNLPLSHDARAKMALAIAERRAEDLDRALVAHRPAIVGQAVLIDLITALDSATVEAVKASDAGASETDMAVLSALRTQNQRLEINRDTFRQAGLTTTDDARERLAQDERALSARLAQFEIRTTEASGVQPSSPASPTLTSTEPATPTTSAAPLIPTATVLPATASPTTIPMIHADETPTPTRELSPSPNLAGPREAQTTSKRNSAATVRPVEPALSPTPLARHVATPTATVPRATPRSTGSGAKPASVVSSPVATKGGQASTDLLAKRVVPMGAVPSDRTLPAPP